ncbi:MAG: hypothetical protein H6682_00640 [Candidatus Eisenbacteria bacterium]|nr:hypothetical protein [Candidatus Eisenbacteria bacterium]
MVRAISVAFLLLVAMAAQALAIPRYSARYGQDCNLCHHDPTGGGKRSAYAAQYLVPAEMSVVQWTDDDHIERLDGQVTSGLSVGTDVRTLYHMSEDNSEQNGFFQMQADFYALFEVDPKFSIYLDQGQSQTREVFALGYVLPTSGHVKVGRFAPAYGWRFADHTLYTREALGFAPPANTDVGIGAGLYPGRAALEVSVTNGARGSGLDDDHRRAATARAMMRQNVGRLGLAVGGSYHYNKSNIRLDRMAGPFGYLQFGPVTWVAEADWHRLDLPGASGADQLVVSQELTYALRRGVDLRATLDFHDPDIDETSGARSRYGIGIDSLVYPFLGIQAMVHVDSFEGGSLVNEDSERIRGSMLFHFFY